MKLHLYSAILSWMLIIAPAVIFYFVGTSSASDSANNIVIMLLYGGVLSGGLIGAVNAAAILSSLRNQVNAATKNRISYIGLLVVSILPVFALLFFIFAISMIGRISAF